MFTQIKNAKFYLQAKLGQRGAEMVEYALVLACVCAVGAIYYATTGAAAGEGEASNTLGRIVNKLWGSVGTSIKDAGVGTTQSGS